MSDTMLKFSPQGIIFESYSQENPGLIGELNPGEEIAIWIKRTLNPAIVKTAYEMVAQHVPGDFRMYEPVEKISKKK